MGKRKLLPSCPGPGELSQVRSDLEETDEKRTVLNSIKPTRTLLLSSCHCANQRSACIAGIHIAVHECVSVLLNRSALVSRPSIGAGLSCL